MAAATRGGAGKPPDSERGHRRTKPIRMADAPAGAAPRTDDGSVKQEMDMAEPTKTNVAGAPAPAPNPAANGDPARRRDAQIVEAQLQWDDRKMATSFANVVNIQSTREQVDLFFGTNQTWNVGSERTLSIELSNRVILSPFAAKRLSVALARVIREYEARYGALDVDQ